MPGCTTHYIFGRETYHKLPNNMLKKNLNYNRAAFALGLLGPDIFFYYLPSYALHSHNPGAFAHTTKTGAFFRALVESRRKFSTSSEQKIAEAYLAGFLGHYTLDSICHPFIYGRTHFVGRRDDYFARHAYLETDIDMDLLAAKLHRTPINFRIANTLSLTFQQKKVISTMLAYAYKLAYPELKAGLLTMFLAIFSTQLGLRILQDDTGQKKVLFRFAEKIFLGYPVFSPLIPSCSLFFRTDPFNMQHKPWTNPWDTSCVSKESFWDLYEKSEVVYLRRLKKLYTLLHSEPASMEENQYQNELFEDYGNLSFHSGLDASIPS